MSANVDSPVTVETQPVQTEDVDGWDITEIIIKTKKVEASMNRLSPELEVIPAHTKDTISFSWKRTLDGVVVSGDSRAMTDSEAIQLMTANPDARALLKAMGYDALKIMGEIPESAIVS